MDLPDNMRRALGLAEQILSELPEEYRPNSNIRDMRGLLAGETSGRDGLIITEAVAVALAYLTQRSIADPPIYNGKNKEAFTTIYNARMQEMVALFEAIQQISAGNFSVCYLQTCVRIGAMQQRGDKCPPS